MNMLDAIYQVLSEASKPLHYKEITKLIIEKGLWETGAEDPPKSVNAGITTEINKRGDESRFYRAGNGVYALNEKLLNERILNEKLLNEKISPRPAKLRQSTLLGGTKPISFTEAAEKILEDAGKPMHYREITDQALELNLISTEGLTPESTMYAQILTEIKRKTKRGEIPRFEMLGKGEIRLTKHKPKGVLHQIEHNNREVRKKLLERILKMDPYDFENLIGELLTAIGFESVSVTPCKNDGGVDVRGTLVVGDVVKILMAVQVKRWKNNVGSPTVRDIRGSLGAHERGLIITTSNFGKPAKEEAERSDTTPIALMNGEQLVSLLVEHNIGIVKESRDIIQLEENEEDEA